MSARPTSILIPSIAVLGLLSQAAMGQGVTRVGGLGAIQPREVIRINCGGAVYLDSLGETWAADQGFNTGTTASTSNPIANTDLDPLYQDVREDLIGVPELLYSFPVAPFQQYKIELHFAEISPAVTGPGQSVFDVALEGVTQLNSFDPYAEAGAPDTAVVKLLDVFVNDAVLDISFTHVVGDPSIAAIYVYWEGMGLVNQPPNITSAPEEFATEGVPYTYDLDASDANAGDVTTYSMVTAPLGATIDPFTGLINWTPMAQVAFNVFVVRATDIGGRFDEQSFKVDTRYRINCGGNTTYIGAGGETWTADLGFNTGNLFQTGQPILGTPDPELYKIERNDPAALPELLYSLNVQNGDYVVRLHFAEIYDQISAPGQRVFDVTLEGIPALVAYDVFAAAGGLFTAIQEDIPVSVTDGVLNIEFLRISQDPKINAIEVFENGQLSATPALLTWGHVPLGQRGATMDILLDNTGPVAVDIDELTYRMQSGHGGHDFEVTLGGVTHHGEHETVVIPVNVTIPVGQSLVVPVVFQPTESVSTVLDLEFSGNFVTQAVELSGIGGNGAGYLHTVIGAPDVVIDFDGDGNEDVFLDGMDSHTHEPGETIISFDWEESGLNFSTSSAVTQNFSVGQHTVQLTIGDSANPQKFLAGSHDFDVVPPTTIPGALVLTYDALGGSPAALLGNLPALPDCAEETTDLHFQELSFISGGTVVRFIAEIDLPAAGNYEFFLNFGGVSTYLLVDNVQTTGIVALSAGTHLLDAQFAVNSSVDLPLDILLAEGGAGAMMIDGSALTHDLSTFAPVINTLLPAVGAEVGGNLVTLEGLGFFTVDQVTVQWGGVLIPNNLLTVTPNSIQLATPAGTGTILVTVNTPQGSSSPSTFDYDPGGPLPVDFVTRDLITGIDLPTVAVWGPDEKLYVGTQEGEIHVITVDDSYAVTGTTIIETISGPGGPTNKAVLGLAFNPFDPPTPVRIYVSHSELYADGGGCLTGAPFPYSGQVSILEGPGYALAPLVTQLPTSNHDHGVNGLDFDRNGDLYINVGGNTNAGLRDCALGDTPPSPFSAATLKAEISKPGFNGGITYIETGTGLVNDDQGFGDIVDVAPGVDVTVFGPGQRNPFDLVYTTWDMVYCTDNGPNETFGESSIASCLSSMNQPTDPDELNLIEFGQYYGHPNCNRGRTVSRESVWHGVAEPGVIGEFTQTLTVLPASVNGVIEYRASTFNGAMRGDLIAQKWGNTTFRIQLSADKRSVINTSPVPTVELGALDVLTGPGGVLLGTQLYAGSVVIAEPIDPSAANLVVYDIFPWRAPAVGGHPFVISGSQFGTVLGDVSVTIGGQSAVVTSVSDTRVRGTVPAHLSSPSELVDVVVNVGSLVQTLPEAFRYLQPAGSEPWGWRAGQEAPVALGEVVSGIVNGKLYIVGEGSSDTHEYDLATETWSIKAARPFPGDHHAAMVHNGLWILFGGLGGSSEGLVQIYDPLLDSWSLGTPMPYAAGSCSVALVNNLIYLCGGIVGGQTVESLAAYDPLLDTWSPLLATMPDGRNHAAAASDGNLLYLFGGRDGANVVGNGYDETQIYDPQTDTWETSAGGGIPLALPEGRGGMGVAVFYKNEFYVMGGETLTGPGATVDNVYERVDIYDPLANTWRIGSPMPTARHGIWPVLEGSEIYVFCGGVQAANSQSAVVEIYAP